MFRYFEKGGRPPAPGFRDLVEFSKVTGMIVTFQADLTEEARVHGASASKHERDAEHQRLGMEESKALASVSRDKEKYANAVKNALT